ncbi:MAG TPA: hypothetical protein VFL64_20800 [Rhizobacter sp.]|nr:hypothetical protein [Rhizobacter sp.]
MSSSLVFALLGPLFLLLALWRFIKTGELVPQAKAWLIVGLVFSAVAAWLWLHQPGAV